ncbi:MAG: phospho-N-acetylmuramoyl-pentapeptide-transferase, partial [Acidimicrobiales bacterium]
GACRRDAARGRSVLVISLLIAVTVSTFVSVFGTPLVMRYFRRHGIGQQIREDGPEGHFTKAGTPTMGGVMIVAGGIAGYAVAHLRKEQERVIFTRAGLLVMLLIIGGAVIGGVDDFLKVSRERSLGLNKRAKIAGQLVLALVFAWLAFAATKSPTTISFVRTDGFHIDLGVVGWIVFVVLLVTGTSNAVNLTDGLDGLAAGTAAFAFSAFALIAFWQFRHVPVYAVPQAQDLAILSVSMLGGCVGFLWWNAAPARIFMGDTGSLAIGAGLAGLALFTRTPLLLPLVGGLFVAETLSVIIQVFSFRVFRRRVFRMAPIHHHFEQRGWPETTVIIRFWLIAGALTAATLGVFYYDYLLRCPGTPGSRPCAAPAPSEAPVEPGKVPG